jgi:hypothetical protein
MLRACMLLALPSKGRCLQSQCLTKGLYATIFLRTPKNGKLERRACLRQINFKLVENATESMKSWKYILGSR